MHAFLRALGFKAVDTDKEEKLVVNALANIHTPEAMRFENTKDNRVFVMYALTKEMGLAISGVSDPKQHVEVEFYAPYVVGTRNTEVNNISIERLGDREAYEVVCESVDNGTTLIFYLINSMDYYNVLKNRGKLELKEVYLSALSTAGIIMLPNVKSKVEVSRDSRKNMIEAARNGDTQAMENLTIGEFEMFSKLNSRIRNEDIYSIVESSLMPCGVECDKYMRVGEIMGIKRVENGLYEEEVWVLSIDANYVKVDVAINASDLLGEPQIGRRFKGQIWLQGIVNFE